MKFQFTANTWSAKLGAQNNGRGYHKLYRRIPERICIHPDLRLPAKRKNMPKKEIRIEQSQIYHIVYDNDITMFRWH